jgi:hypothetical protein
MRVVSTPSAAKCVMSTPSAAKCVHNTCWRLLLVGPGGCWRGLTGWHSRVKWTRDEGKQSANRGNTWGSAPNIKEFFVCDRMNKNGRARNERIALGCSRARMRTQGAIPPPTGGQACACAVALQPPTSQWPTYHCHAAWQVPASQCPTGATWMIKASPRPSSEAAPAS